MLANGLAVQGSDMKKFTHAEGKSRMFTSPTGWGLEPRHAGKAWVVLFPCADNPHGLERGQRYARNLQSNPDYYF
ncbi:hypothetical protein VCRA2126O298_420010 [Vibrio crassostreae]|nr:hypothetical protein VCRA2126O293_430007 [Vibrio crassostreae]CAK3485533.1 hypothetical protein VCRA2123O280_420010 [Vibrio crassostreae]CAK3515330.1 hypothetical protein VCRA2126O298_420010 [Vibrio crassostreae]CAK3569797.1 hypothetical protein VCRA2126O292_420004 [Vibrio crassostreae]CAK3935939.1 hypothetical protein VCRA2126O294_440004 [Vibrio crassostreae]